MKDSKRLLILLNAKKFLIDFVMVKNKEKAKSLQILINELDAVFSKYIRYRDMRDGKVICFICGAKVPFAEAQAMHYVDRDQMATRYDEMNVNGGCENCNCYDGNHKARYFAKLFLIHGQDNVLSMINRSRLLQKFMRFELEYLIIEYTEKVKQQRKQKGL